VTSNTQNTRNKRRALAQGTRVRLRAPSHLLTLRSDTGNIVRREDEHYYIVQLDEPAIYDNGVQHIDALSEIRAAWDNLDVLSAPAAATGSSRMDGKAEPRVGRGSASAQANRGGPTRGS
jgi:hypothetical protein